MEARVFGTPPPPGARPSPPIDFQLGDGLLLATQDALREGSAGRRESTVLWAGRPLGESTAFISHLLLPAFLSRHDFLTIPQEERIRIATYLRTEGLMAFADLHTHPRRAFLSEPDRERPFSQKDGFYAIVIPDFGRRGPAAGWRFYEARSGEWHEIEPAERIDGWPV